jgi:NAD(P)H dehydrogenase (quinone)
MILVTGAAGKTGRAVIRALAQRGQTVRAWVRSIEQAAPVIGAGAAEAVAGDFGNTAVLEHACTGVDAIYFICSNMHPDEVSIGRTLIDAARGAGVRQFVYHSVLHPQTEAMPHHWCKLRVEELLVGSGLPFTILQPAVYMQNLLAQWPALRTQGILRNPYPPEAQLSFVDLEDVAGVAAKVLCEAGHLGATYELAGTGAKSQHEVAGILANVLGLPIRAEQIALEGWVQEARKAGRSEATIDALKCMFAYYAAHGLVGNPNLLGWLLGRQPTSLTAFARRAS